MKNVEDFYPLSPMQQGMLFHSLFQPESGVYVEQVACTLRGSLDIEAFKQAWQRVVDRHTILRTAFVGEALKEPVQVVHKQVTLPIEEQNWRGFSEEEQKQKLETYLLDERKKGFDLSEPPLMRLAFFRTGENTYRFVWNFHHILLDGWSNPLLLREVFAFYEAISTSQPVQLDPALPYKRYIAWLKRQDRGAAEQYWRSTLEGFTTPTPLVTARPVEAVSAEEEHYTEKAVWVPAQMTTRLQTLARQNALTLNTLVQAAWALLLSRYSGEKDVVFGTTVSGRPGELPGAENMIGLFINTLPVRVKIDESVRILDYLKQLQAQSVKMRQFEYSPLVNVQEWSQVPAGTPLFNTLMVFENYPVSAIAGEQSGQGIFIEDITSEERTNYGLNLVAGAADELMLKAIYDERQFDAGSIDRMLGHLQNLLAGMVEHPEMAVKDLDLMSAAEKQQVLVDFNQTAMDFDLSLSIPDQFEEQVRRQPDALAVTDGQETLTYAQLNAKSNQLAYRLQKSGIGSESLVAILTERSAQMVVAALAVFKCGAAYLPIDTNYPADRVKFMLEDSRVPILLTQSHLLDHIAPAQTAVICLDSGWPSIEMEPESNPTRAIAPDTLAYVIYTSGSTGKPKGVMIEHRGLQNLIQWHLHAFQVTAADRATQVAGQAFDATVWEIWPALAVGASLYIAPEEVRASPPAMRDWLVANQITISFMPTPVVDIILGEDWPESASLRIINTGGDKLHQFPRPGMPFRIFNNYGPTENSCVTTSGEVLPGGSPEMTPAIGCPISNHQVYILDDAMRPVPVGVPGELFAGGMGIARGYLNRPELTAEVFVPDPFSKEPGAKLYKTGDLVKWRPDGQIDFLARKDQQVKVRGFRIELGEIESVLREHAEVREAVVLAREDQPGDKRLVAYIVPAEDCQPASGDLRVHLLQQLPAYMIPSVFVTLEALPITPNGKVDRKALPSPDGGDRPLLATPFVLPHDMLEQQLVHIWEEVLDYQPIGTRDNFFELGGHSLIAVRLMAQIQKHFNRTVPIMELFKEPTVEHLATILRKSDGNTTLPSLVEIQPKGKRLPLYFIHPSGGSVHWYMDLSKQLGEEQPFYGLQAQGLYGDREIHTTIPDMAAHYIKEIRAFQPKGPYMIASWSMGVIVAYEMAQQLVQAGEQVPLLLMVDQGPFLPGHIPADEPEYLVDAFGKYVPLSIEKLRELSSDQRMQYVLEEAKRVNFIYPEITINDFSHFVRILKADMDAWRKYSILPYSGQITLIRATEQPEVDYAPDLDWGKLAPDRVDIYEITGNHLSIMVEPDVENLAALIHQIIQKSLSGTPGES